MDKPDIATVIDSHFEEMTDLEQEIARYFCKLKRLQMIYLSTSHPKITYFSGCSDPLC